MLGSIYSNKLAKDIAKEILNGTIEYIPALEDDFDNFCVLNHALCNEMNTIAPKRSQDGTMVFPFPDIVATEEAWFEIADRYVLFMMKYKPEFGIAGTKAAISSFMVPFNISKMEHFHTFANRYKKYILGPRG